MAHTFYKYHGAGNDFILFDNRLSRVQLSSERIAELCHRHYGIGADGLMLLEQPRHEGDDFYMVYYNADGNESTMCGNGGRCIAKFAQDLGLIQDKATFTAIDGPHWATFDGDQVALGMVDAPAVEERHGGLFINTGSPHHVENRMAGPDFVSVARELRNRYGAEGCNINFIQACNDELSIRTYERGVEGETLACGTGATGAAMVAVAKQWVSAAPVKLYAQGGVLEVDFKGTGPFTDVVLKGPAIKVFEGTIEL